jgi:hypothetical protein
MLSACGWASSGTSATWGPPRITGMPRDRKWASQLVGARSGSGDDRQPDDVRTQIEVHIIDPFIHEGEFRIEVAGNE